MKPPRLTPTGELSYTERISRLRLIRTPQKCESRTPLSFTSFIRYPSLLMPAHFKGFGLELLYPENWTLLPRADDEGDQGATLELPSGGFVSIETLPLTRADDELLTEIESMLREQYSDVESEEVQLAGADEGERAVDTSFYHLDLVVFSRVVLLDSPASTRQQMPIAGRLLVQFQAESRDFDENEMVFTALLKQIRDTP